MKKIYPIRYCAKEQQDIFAYRLCGNDGYYWDVGCNEPCHCKGDWGNNTYSLEKHHGWRGLLFDIRTHYTDKEWDLKSRKKSKFFPIDVTSDEFSEVLKLQTEVDCVDYVSLDIDNNGTLSALDNILKTNIPFKTMTLEHNDDIGETERTKDVSRTMLKTNGYVPIFLDVKFYPRHSKETGIFEDWWVHPSYFNKKITSIREEKLYYDECISKLPKRL